MKQKPSQVISAQRPSFIFCTEYKITNEYPFPLKPPLANMLSAALQTFFNKDYR